MTARRPALAGALLCLLMGAATAQRHHDPLNQVEIDQLRETAQEADARLKLYIAFVRVRVDALSPALSDPKVADRGQEVHDRLQDFLDIYDEFDRNVDTFADRKADLRKVLKFVIEADTEFQSKLRAVKDSSAVGRDAVRKYDFLLTSALDAVDHAAEDHRKLLAQQEEDFKHKRRHRTEGGSARQE